MERVIKYIVLHTTATPTTATVEGIKRYWKNNLGWSRVGYHAIIKRTGEVEHLASLNEPTNGVKGHNHHSIHISYIGGIDQGNKPVDNRTREQMDAMYFLIKGLLKVYPDAEVIGHRDFKGVSKACPCFNAKEWYESYTPYFTN
jgi:N-acetylmuramoyl-L-alanine amidase